MSPDCKGIIIGRALPYNLDLKKYVKDGFSLRSLTRKNTGEKRKIRGFREVPLISWYLLSHPLYLKSQTRWPHRLSDE